MTFGERLYELRKKSGLSQEQLAEKLEVSRQSISKWESDKAYPEMTRLLFMSDYFGVSLDYLMRGEETPASEQTPDEHYQPEQVSRVLRSFLSNLTASQKQKLMLLYVLAVFVLAAAGMLLAYGIGEALGEFLYHVTH
ncbi:MAG: helix-turn-helix transcriptional regulator [Oscillospiraceae bacterium]|nr:helix-turn-helix transcriptional regulator [Oscillospiraceae bacterium]